MPALTALGVAPGGHAYIAGGAVPLPARCIAIMCAGTGGGLPWASLVGSSAVGVWGAACQQGYMAGENRRPPYLRHMRHRLALGMDSCPSLSVHTLGAAEVSRPRIPCSSIVGVYLRVSGVPARTMGSGGNLRLLGGTARRITLLLALHG